MKGTRQFHKLKRLILVIILQQAERARETVMEDGRVMGQRSVIHHSFIIYSYINQHLFLICFDFHSTIIVQLSSSLYFINP